MTIEVTIIKKLFLTTEIELADDATPEDLKKAILNEISEHQDLEDWDETDWCGKERYEAYETDGGNDIDLD